MAPQQRPSFRRIYRQKRRIAANEPFALSPAGPRGWMKILAGALAAAAWSTWHAHQPLALSILIMAAAVVCAATYWRMTLRRLREVRAHPDPITPEQVRAQEHHPS